MKHVYKPNIDEVRGDTPWSAAEALLLDACKHGRGVVLGPDPDNPDDPWDPEVLPLSDLDDKGRPKDTGNPHRKVRAGLIRYLLLGGCDTPECGYRPHPKGVELHRAWIEGDLDFAACTSRLDLKLFGCRIEGAVTFRDAELGGLYLLGSRLLRGVDLHRVEVETHVHLRNGFESVGTVDLGSARIGGQLDCTGGRFDGAGGKALNCDAARIGADVFLRGGFHATGLVDFIRAEIGGQFACTGGRFDGAGGKALNCAAARIGADVFLCEGFHATGTVDFTRADVTGNAYIMNATLAGGMGLQTARIGEALVLSDITGPKMNGPPPRPDAPDAPPVWPETPPRRAGAIDLTDTTAGLLVDTREAWEAFSPIDLSHFRYERLDRIHSVDFRLGWLKRAWQDALRPSPYGKGLVDGKALDFDPFPYTHLAKVVDETGHRRAAARIREVREDRTGRAERARALARLTPSATVPLDLARVSLRRLWSCLFKALFGYGHRPGRALLSVLAVWVLAWGIYGNAYRLGQMAPNSDVVLTSENWLAAEAGGCDPIDWEKRRWDWWSPLHAAPCDMPLHRWLEDAPEAADYETFNARLYALDLFVPLDTLGQETAWAPSRDRGWAGWIAYAMRMPIQMAGWIITAVGAAVLTGLVGRKD